MVSVSKMKKAQDRMRASRPYVDARAADRDARRQGEHRVQASVPRQARERAARRRDRRHDRQGTLRRPQHEPAAPRPQRSTRSGGPRASKSTTARSATRAWAFSTRLGANVVSQVVQLGDRPRLDKLVGPVKVLLDKYIDGDHRRGAHLLHDVHQHDEAGGAARRHAADPRGVPGAGHGEVRTADAATGRGTTSTSPTRRRCSTACCGATPRRSCSRW